MPNHGVGVWKNLSFRLLAIRPLLVEPRLWRRFVGANVFCKLFLNDWTSLTNRSFVSIDALNAWMSRRPSPKMLRNMGSYISRTVALWSPTYTFQWDDILWKSVSSRDGFGEAFRCGETWSWPLKKWNRVSAWRIRLTKSRPALPENPPKFSRFQRR